MAAKPKRTPLFNSPPADSSSASEEESDEEEEQPTPRPPSKQPPLPLSKPKAPAAAEPDDESEETEEEDTEDDDDNEEEPKSLPLTQKPTPKPIAKEKNPKPQSPEDDDDEEESGSDEESESSGPEQKGPGKPKAAASNPVPVKSKTTGNSKPVAKAGAGIQPKKRQMSPHGGSEVVDGGKGKKAKVAVTKGAAKDDDVGKKTPRIWSEEDEIVLLEGFLEFQARDGVSPYSEIGRFHEMVKDRFSMSVDKIQLKEKLRRLKDKFNRMKGHEGKSPDFAKPHDGRCFELFNKIWGNGDGSGSVNGSHADVNENVNANVNANVKKSSPGTPNVKSGKKSGSTNGSNVVVVEKAAGSDGNVGNNGEVEAPMDVDVVKVVPPRQDGGELGELYPHLMQALKSKEGCVGGAAVLSSIGLLGESELKGLDDKWKKVKMTELQLYMKEMERRKEEADFLKEQADLLKEQANMVFNAMKFH